MKIGRKNWIAVLCISTALAFFGQMMLCFADRAGIVPCCDSDYSEHRHDPSPSDTSSQANCCHSFEQCVDYYGIGGTAYAAFSRRPRISD